VNLLWPVVISYYSYYYHYLDWLVFLTFKLACNPEHFIDSCNMLL